MTRTEELEAALRADWTDEALSVYADHLQSEGDPRGELIALDLDGSDAEPVIARRGDLFRKWLGAGTVVETWWDPTDRRWCAGNKKEGTWIVADYGLLEISHAPGDVSPHPETLLRFLATPASRFVHRCSIAGDTACLRRLISKLTVQKRPWLRALGIRRLDDEHMLALPDTTAFDAALPNLTHVDLSGPRVLDHIDHAGVTTLVVTGGAISLAAGAPLSSVTTLDFAFELETGSNVAHYLRRERLPNVRRLGLSRHEPPHALDLKGLASLEIADQLSQLELPTLRSPADARAVELIADRMRMLRELVIARAYSCFGDCRVELARARVTHPTVRPWPPRDEIDEPWLRAAGEAASVVILIETLEQVYDQLPSEIRDIWMKIWNELGIARWTRIRPSALLAALEALGLDDPDWQKLFRRVQDYGTDVYLSLGDR